MTASREHLRMNIASITISCISIGLFILLGMPMLALLMSMTIVLNSFVVVAFLPKEEIVKLNPPVVATILCGLCATYYVFN